MTHRPKINLKLTPTEKIVELAGWVSLIGIWIFTFTTYQSLPEKIPIHFNGTGEADKLGDKYYFFFLPIMSSILFLGLTVLNRFPHLFNYPTSITPENAYRQYRSATRLIRALKLIIVVLSGLIIYKKAEFTEDTGMSLGPWFLPLTIALFIIPLIYFLLNTRPINGKSPENIND